MNQMQIIMRIVPAEFWISERDPTTALKPFVRDAMDIERRLPKKVNLANERIRYQLCCQRIQEAVCRLGLDDETETLSSSYLGVLRSLADKYPADFTSSRISACFFPPDILQKSIHHIQELTDKAGFSDDKNLKKRVEFFKIALRRNAGVVETSHFLIDTVRNLSLENERSTGYPLSGPLSHFNDSLSEVERKSLKEVLCARIEQGLSNRNAVNFSNQPHSVIAESLNRFVYSNPSKTAGEIRVVYMDGTEAAPFPVYGISAPENTIEWDEVPPVNASLISMRHLEMDDRVDISWFRNCKVSTSAPFAEIDAYCTAETIKTLQGMPDGEKLHLHLYQTGLETAVVGFYRGLVQILKEFHRRNNGPQIRVVPYYYDHRKDGRYEAGNPWE